MNFAGSGTENLSGLRDSLDAVAPSSYALTADNGLKLDDMRYNIHFKVQDTAEIICMRSIRCLKQKEISDNNKKTVYVAATSSDRSEISGIWRIKLPQRLILSLR